VTRWQAVYRWIGAVLALALLAGAWYLVFGRNLGNDNSLVGETARRQIDVVADLGARSAEECSVDRVDISAVDLDQRLGDTSTSCVLLGARGVDGGIEWFFVGRATGTGTVRVPRPAEVGQTRAALVNGAVVSLSTTVRVRCTADPNARFETWIADGLATAGYLDADARLVAIDCREPEE
jgi:hypothetical protein